MLIEPPVTSWPPPDKPLKLTAAGFGRTAAVLDTNRGSLMSGRS